MAHALYLAIPVLVVPAPLLANRAHLSSYARAIANLLQMGGATAFTQISIRIPISDPAELIHQGPAGPSAPQPNGSGPNANGSNNTNGSERMSTIEEKRHKRMSSMSTRPTSIHQGSASNTLPVLPAGMRIASAASATSSVMSARSAAPPAFARGDPSSTWEMWDTIRRICNYHPRLSVSTSSKDPSPSQARLMDSSGLDASASTISWCPVEVDFGASEEHLAANIQLHWQCQRISRAEQSLSSVPPWHVQGELLSTTSIHS